MNDRQVKSHLRQEVAFWQRGAFAMVGLLLILGLCAAFVVSQLEAKTERQAQEIANLEAQCTTAQEIQRDAVERLGEIVREFEAYRAQVERDRVMEEAARAQAMAAYEAVGMYRYIGECTLTAYCCESKGNPHICGTGTGLTASGLPVAPGMVAVDPSIIPLGSTVIINGISYLAADTGVTGYHIDIAIQTHEEAEAFGVSSAEVWIIPPGGEESGR